MTTRRESRSRAPAARSESALRVSPGGRSHPRSPTGHSGTARRPDDDRGRADPDRPRAARPPAADPSQGARSQTDIGGTANYFTLPALEKKIGKVTISTNAFGEADSYALFAHVMGQNMSTTAMIPTNTSTSVRWYSGLLNQSWLDGVVKNRVIIDTPIKEVHAVFAWGGDLNWSHSSDPAVIASRISSGIYTNSINGEVNVLKTMSTQSMAYRTEAVETAKLSVTSTLENGKVVLTTTLTKEELAGLQVIMNYDDSKLTLDNVIFDAGSTMTNFSTKEDGRLTFGSIDQLKTARIKVGTPYKLIFAPKVNLTNTAGLFYFVLSDAVDAKGNKIDLIIE